MYWGSADRLVKELWTDYSYHLSIGGILWKQSVSIWAKHDVREMKYVGNEEKAIVGANQSGMMSVLIDREKRRPEWNQGRTIQSLKELLLLM